MGPSFSFVSSKSRIAISCVSRRDGGSGYRRVENKTPGRCISTYMAKCQRNLLTCSKFHSLRLLRRTSLAPLTCGSRHEATPETDVGTMYIIEVFSGHFKTDMNPSLMGLNRVQKHNGRKLLCRAPVLIALLKINGIPLQQRSNRRILGRTCRARDVCDVPMIPMKIRSPIGASPRALSLRHRRRPSST